MTLLTAMGFGSLSACSGKVVSLAGGDDAGSTGGAEHSTGAVAGASSGGASSGGASTGGVSTGGNAGAGGSGGVAAPCQSPVPVTTSGTGTGPTGGYVRCADGTVRRPTVDECWSNIDPNGMPILGSVMVDYGCRKHADCTAHPHGYCGAFGTVVPGAQVSTSCVYGCVRDSECAAGQICLCGDPVGACVDARCTSDEDCSAGTPCRLGEQYGVCNPATVHFTCGPLCVKDDDCTVYSGSYSRCMDGDCLPSAMCGRPFIVGHAPRLAGVEHRSGWASPLSPDVAALPSDVRRALAEHYTAIGLMEHASVAAFARFSLELLALGAPAEIVRLSADAMRDETEHAKLCFGLAAAYGGKAVGPGPLDVTGALEPAPLREKLRTAFLEACLGETCAAVEAAEAAARATDPVVAAVLGRISADETRHAELGWRFVKWALDAMDFATRAAVLRDLRAAVDRELDAVEEAVEARSDSELLIAHGVLPPSLRAALRRATIADVVVPCLRRLSFDVSAALASFAEARVA